MSVQKEELHRLVDALPEQKSESAKRLLELLLAEKPIDDVWAEILANPPIDAEPLNEDDKKAIKEAQKDVAEGRVKPWAKIKRNLGVSATPS